MRPLPLVSIACLLAACSGERAVNDQAAAPAAPDNAAARVVRNLPKPDLTVSATDAASLPQVEPIAPGQPGGLPDDRTPISEAPFTPDSAQGAADVVQRYFALIGERKFREAYALWSSGGQASGQSGDGFAADLNRYRQYDAQVGAPGRVEGAAGSRYVTVPVQVYGRSADGKPFHRFGQATLRRTEVDGATSEQRTWHIESMDLKSQP